MTLRLTNFGVRGHVGTSLTPRVVMDYAAAFATFVNGGRVLLARDTRYSSPMLHAAAQASLLAAGCEVLDFGVCPAPLLQFSVPAYGAAGALCLSGGHHPAGWNALTLFGADGAVLEPTGGEAVLDRFHAGNFLQADWRHTGFVRAVSDYAEPYFVALERHVNVEAVRARKFAVLVDPVGGAACAFLDTFAQRLGFRLLGVNAQPTGYLPREPEPRPRSALQMASIIGHLQGDVGFLLSSDAGRVSVVTETGEPASEEYTFALVADHVLAKQAGTVVTNCCTSRMVDDIAAYRESPVVKSAVGQASVMARLDDERGVLGGEGSGSVVLPAFNRAFDGFLAMALILESMAESGQKLSALLRRMPRYHMVKRQLPCEAREAYRALERIKQHLLASPGGTVDLTDGVRVDWPDGWVHVRASRTEQIVRVLAEATSREVAERRAEDVVRALDQVV